MSADRPAGSLRGAGVAGANAQDDAQLSRVGRDVRIDIATADDVPAYRRAVQESAERLRDWNPVNPGDLDYHLRMQSPLHRTFLVKALEPGDGHGIVGKVNVTNVVRGRALAGALGYDSYDPYAGRGLFAQGLRLVVDVALTPSPRGLGLHRVEASVQPGNTRSGGLLRRIGFRPRGDWPGYLWLADASGVDEWRDHVTYGVTQEQWPAPDYAPRRPARPVVVLLCPTANAAEPEAQVVRDPSAVAIGRALGIELGVPVVRDEGDLPVRLTDAVSGAVVLTARAAGEVVPDLVAAGVDAPVVAQLSSITGAADLVRLALQARASAGVDAA